METTELILALRTWADQMKSGRKGLVNEAADRLEELDEIAQHNVDKLRKRYPDGFSAENSLHRKVAVGPDGLPW